jgi:uncharacterized protein
MFTLTHHADAESFLAVALEALEKQETANNLILGVPLRLRMHPERVKMPPLLVTVHTEAGTLAGAAMRTPPYHLVVHVEEGFGADVLDALMADLLERQVEINGVNGRAPWSGEWARRWQQATGTAYTLGTALRAFELRQVIPPPAAPGALRKAGPGDFAVVAAFLRAFDAEALPNDPNARSDESIRLIIEDGNIHLWEVDGVAVSLVGRSRPLLHGMTVAPVYTPPAERGKGYAGNAVATLSQMLLDAGWHFCALFTDLANPTANSLYQKMGYRPVCNYADYIFER